MILTFKFFFQRLPKATMFEMSKRCLFEIARFAKETIFKFRRAASATKVFRFEILPFVLAIFPKINPTFFAASFAKIGIDARALSAILTKIIFFEILSTFGVALFYTNFRHLIYSVTVNYFGGRYRGMTVP
jgi:hypothetical protein